MASAFNSKDFRAYNVCSLISFELGDYTCIYSVNTPIRTFVEDNKYYYWFLPTSKKIVPISGITPEALDAAYREGVNSI